MDTFHGEVSFISPLEPGLNLGNDWPIEDSESDPKKGYNFYLVFFFKYSPEDMLVFFFNF